MKVGKNHMLAGCTGKIGNTGFYIRILNGREIIQRCPSAKRRKGLKTLTPQNTAFREATMYSSMANSHEVMRELYTLAAGGRGNAQSMAVKDYMTQAVIARVITTGYQGRKGYTFRMEVDNVIPVKSVRVTIGDPGEEAIESGPAVFNPEAGFWEYTTRKANPGFRDHSLTISATDHPGHTVTTTRSF